MFNTEKLRRGRGRTRKEDTRQNMFCIRFSDEEMRMLRRISVKTGFNLSEIIRRSIMMMYNNMDFYY